MKSVYSPLNRMLIHCRITSIKFAGTYLYTWVERGTLRVKWLAQEHDTMSQAEGSKQDRSLHSRARLPWGHPPTLISDLMRSFFFHVCTIRYWLAGKGYRLKDYRKVTVHTKVTVHPKVATLWRIYILQRIRGRHVKKGMLHSLICCVTASAYVGLCLCDVEKLYLGIGFKPKCTSNISLLYVFLCNNRKLLQNDRLKRKREKATRLWTTTMNLKFLL